MTFNYLELKRINQALEMQTHMLQNRIEKRQNMIDGKYKTANKGGVFNKAKLIGKTDEDQDRIIAIESVQIKVKDEMRRLAGAEVAPLKRA